MQTSLPKKQRFTIGFNAGLGAGIIATALMLLLSITIGGVSLPEALASSIAQNMPLPLFEYLHRTVGDNAKYYLFYGVLVGQCLVFALSGGLCSLLALKRTENEHGQLHWRVGLILAGILWLLTGVLFLPLVGAGIFGLSLVTGITNTMVSLAIVGLIFGAIYIFLQNWLVLLQLRKQTPDVDSSLEKENAIQRRSFVRNSLVVLALGGLGVVAWRFIINSGGALSNLSQGQLLQKYQPKISPPPQPNYGTIQSVANLSPEVTSNDQYYVVSKNFLSDPTVDGKSWQLSISGQVAQPYTLNYNQLMAIPRKQQYESMMCISNEVGGSYMSNALWEGVPLADLLQRAGNSKPGATKVVLHAADGYSDSIHLSKALEPTTLVAVYMNGVGLPQGHGYPARLLVPGIYGMKHVKWITGIEVVDTDFQGYWQQNGWSDPAPIRMTSRIDTPAPNASLTANKATYIAGVAFSGNKGISQVDVSLDGGQTWQVATLKKPLSELTWVLWEIPWQPKAGNYTITVRAIDKEGNVQDPHTAPPLPDGSSGYHNITITVA